MRSPAPSRPAALPRSVAVLVLGSVILAGCDESDGGGAQSGIESLGSGFVAAFGQDANSDPVEASDLDLTQTPENEPFNP